VRHLANLIRHVRRGFTRAEKNEPGCEVEEALGY
jgi:hypothetical protein